MKIFLQPFFGVLLAISVMSILFSLLDSKIEAAPRNQYSVETLCMYGVTYLVTVGSYRGEGGSITPAYKRDGTLRPC